MAAPHEIRMPSSPRSLRLASVALPSARASSRVAPSMTTQNSSPERRPTRLPGRAAAAATSASADALQRAVARVVAGPVVDRLQLVHVAQQHGELGLVLGGARHRALQALLQRTPVREARERILVGQPRHAREQLGAADRHGQLARDGLEEAHVLAAEARLAGRGGRVDLAPGVALDEDRHADLGLLAEPRQAARRRPGRCRAASIELK